MDKNVKKVSANKKNNINKKYVMLKDDYIINKGRILYRIKAIKDFDDVKNGDLGGYIEKEENLSHEGNCWIFDNAKVFNNAKVYDCAKIYNLVEVCDSAEVYGNALVRDSAHIYNSSKIHGSAKIYNYAEIFGSAKVYDFAEIHDIALVFGSARVYNSAIVCGTTSIYGSAQISYGELDCDIFEDMEKYIACSLNIYPIGGKYYLYKKVDKIDEGKYCSLYDKNFIYELGKVAVVQNVDENKIVDCGNGLHVSTLFYWNEDDTLITCEIDVKDVITCMNGKLRVRKLKVIDEVKSINIGSE